MSNVDVKLQMLKPDFDSPLTDVVIELDKLRHLRLRGNTPAHIFYQIKSIFHFLESMESARIEGNRTTIAEYIDAKIEKEPSQKEGIWELENIQKAMNLVEREIQPGSEITHATIREIHRIVVDGLKREGDQTPGSYRQNKNVKISGSNHTPPDWASVLEYMDELIEFLNEESPAKYDLLKIAIAHHRFTWIHPFGNGNGRVVRILTYLLLIKYGFNPQNSGRILNPTAVFCNDRNKYYEMLSLADEGVNDGLEQWCIYILSGMSEELKRVDKLTDYDYLKNSILFPALEYSLRKKIITEFEKKVLRLAVDREEFKAKDLDLIDKNLDARKKTYEIKKLLESKMIAPTKENGRTYVICFTDNDLFRGVMDSLINEGFTSTLSD